MLKGIELGSAACKAECLDVCTDLFKRFGLFMLRKQSLLNRDQFIRVITTQLT